MKKFLFLIITVISIHVYSENTAHSIGLGAYIEGGGGGAFYILPSGYSERNSGQFFAGGGIMFDTSVSTNTLFNYRVGFAYNWTRATTYTPPEYYLVNKVITPGNLDLNQIKLVNSFGFGVIRTETIRFWLGPQLIFFYNWGDTTIIGVYSGWNINRKDTVSVGGLGLGFVAGINFNFTGIVTLALEFGVRVNVAGGSTYGTYSYNSSAQAKKEIALVGIYPEGFATVGVIFRILEK